MNSNRPHQIEILIKNIKLNRFIGQGKDKDGNTRDFRWRDLLIQQKFYLFKSIFIRSTREWCYYNSNFLYFVVKVRRNKK